MPTWLEITLWIIVLICAVKAFYDADEARAISEINDAENAVLKRRIKSLEEHFRRHTDSEAIEKLFREDEQDA